MMLDHGSFSCLQFPKEWEQPKFKLGDTVLCDGEQGLIVGAFYASHDSCDPEFDKYEWGWWFEVALPCDVGKRVAKNVLGFHESVIQPVLTGVDTEIQQQQVCIPPANTLEPLCFGVF